MISYNVLEIYLNHLERQVSSFRDISKTLEVDEIFLEHWGCL